MKFNEYISQEIFKHFLLVSKCFSMKCRSLKSIAFVLVEVSFHEILSSVGLWGKVLLFLY